MPAFIQSPQSRRAFLKTAALGAATIAALPLRAQNDSPPKQFRIALLSDPHIPHDPTITNRGFNMTDNFRRITAEVLATKPQLIVLNGDAARAEGKIEEYQAVSELLKPLTAAAPVTVSMGNHDDRANFATVFKAVAGEKQKVAGKHVLVLEHEITRFIVLDSLMYTNKAAGQLGRAQRDWLAKYLPTITDRPAVIFVHHSLEDNDGELTDTDKLFVILQPNPHVKALIYGHSHVWGLQQRQNVQLINLPAIGYNFRDQDPVGWMESTFTPTGVQLTMRAFGGNTATNNQKFDIKWA